MHRIAFGLAGVLLAACAGATPSGFSKGDHWSFPLVGSLENGHLITVGSVNGQGPYLFLIDPDSSVSAVDQQVIDEAKLRMGKGPARIDEANTEQQRGYAELGGLKLGDLTIDTRLVMAVPKDFYNVEGRRVHGLIGRDVISDRLVFGFDRDQGIATLSTPAVFAPPPGATAIKYEPALIDTGINETSGGAMTMSSTNNDDASRIGVATHHDGPPINVATVARRVAPAQVGGSQLKMHLDFGDTVSQLREALWPAAKLTPAKVELRLADEVASVRTVTSAPSADATLAGLHGHVTLAPYVDKRFGLKKLDGSLGLDFFKAYSVYASWQTNTLYVKPRGEAAATTTARLGRWGADLPQCPHPGCVNVTLTPTDGGLKLDVVRDPQAAKRPLEVFLGATPAAGMTAANLLVELPPGADSISGAVPIEYGGATLTVLDASVFTRPCSGDGGCVFPSP